MTNMPSGSDLGSTGRTSGGTAQQVKDSVRDTTNNLTNVAKEQARSAYDKKKNLLFGEVDSLAAALREAGGKLRSQNDGSLGAQLTDRIAERLEAVTTRLGDKDLDGIIRDVEGFGRSNPTMFLGVAAALGFLAIRFAKSSARPSFDDQWNSTSGPQSDVVSPRSPLISHAEEL